MRRLHKADNYLKNYVRIELRGTSPEKFLNACARAGIDLWDTKYLAPNCLELTMRARQYLEIAPLVRRTACRVRIKKKGGARYALRRMAKRPALVIGAALLAAVCVLFNSLVLSFDFTGYETVTPRRLMEAMEKNGLSVGTWKRSVDASDLRNFMLSDIPELIWFTVTFHGSRASVDVRERDKVPETVSEAFPADIVSDSFGVVRNVSVYKGTAQVKAGDTVAPGRVLVSSNVKLRYDEREILVHARGEILADVWYRRALVCPAECGGKTYTGREKTRLALIIGRKRINFYKNDGKVFDSYDKITMRHQLSFFGVELPLALVREKTREYESFFSEYDCEEAGQRLTELARKKLMEMDVGMELTEAGARTDGGLIYAYAYGKCQKNIGQTVLRQ